MTENYGNRKVFLLEFAPEHSDFGNGKKLSDGLSAVVQIENTIWVANDETVSLERFTLEMGNENGIDNQACHHRQFALNDYLRLPISTTPDSEDIAEVDVEGLAYEDGYIWLVGSHSRTRTKPKIKDGRKKMLKDLAEVRNHSNRYLLARIPLLKSDGTYTLQKEVTETGKKRTAASLHGNDAGNDLTEALRNDEHLGGFLGIPCKENGFDIEGLTARGKRLFLGLRGPVLRGWSVIVEVELIEDTHQPQTLRLKEMGSNGRPYRKHFLQMGGLGIRDLCVQGSDILILAGPTMHSDGPISIFRWKGGVEQEEESIVLDSELEFVMEIPHGKGEDYAEGMALFSPDGGKAESLLVVYDHASDRRQRGKGVAADLFCLP